MLITSFEEYEKNKGKELEIDASKFSDADLSNLAKELFSSLPSSSSVAVASSSSSSSFESPKVTLFGMVEDIKRNEGPIRELLESVHWQLSSTEQETGS